MKFQPIETAPVGKHAADRILCRFWYKYLGGNWVYFVAFPNGANTKADGYAQPEEWTELEIR